MVIKKPITKVKTTKVSPKKEKVVKTTKKSTTSLKKEKKSSSSNTVVNDKVILRIRVRAYENKILDASVKQIIDTALRYDAVIVGPVPLPTEIKKYTVNRASFIYKNAREQFEIRVHKRLIDIINPNPKTVDALTNLSLPSGVDIDVKML
jgi:small subunit ribosomal protein S10